MEPWLDRFLSVGGLRSVAVAGAEVPVEHPSVALLSTLAKDDALPSESRILNIQGKELDARVEVYGSGLHQTLAIKSEPSHQGPSVTSPGVRQGMRP